MAQRCRATWNSVLLQAIACNAKVPRLGLQCVYVCVCRKDLKDLQLHAMIAIPAVFWLTVARSVDAESHGHDHLRTLHEFSMVSDRSPCSKYRNSASRMALITSGCGTRCRTY